MMRRNLLRRPRADAGFTVVELIVALTAGLVVSAAAYLLARNSMQSFQDESRIATSQVAVSVGMSRLQADLARAGYMASPNIALDPKRCPSSAVTAVPITAVEIREGTAAMNGLADATYGYGGGVNAPLQQPDVIVLAGNMTSTEQFEFRGSDGTNVYLALDRGPMVRLLRETDNDAIAIQSVFTPLTIVGAPVANRYARIVDQSGKESYVEVVAVTVTGTPIITAVTLSIVAAGGGGPATNVGTECGFVNRGTGLINPVSIIRYRIGQLCDPTVLNDCAASPYALALAAARPGEGALSGEATRTDLLREELTPAAARAGKFANYALGPNGLASQEIAAEFAVQLDMAASWDSSPAASPGTALTVIPFNAGGATDIEGISAATPQKLRSLQVRFSTRARYPDRDSAGQQVANPSVMTRFQLTTVDANARTRFARMRTLETEIQLPNLMGVTW